jgi:sulfatase modifying factor 1
MLFSPRTLLPTFLFLLACGGKTPTAGLEVVITTCDLQVGTDFDAIQAVVSQGTFAQNDPWNQLFDAAKHVPRPIVLPTTLAIRPGTSPDQDALIEVSALLGGEPVVQRVLRTKVPTDHVGTLWIFLAADCRGKMCSVGETCEPQTASCVPIDTAPGNAPERCKSPDGGSTDTSDATLADGGGAPNEGGDSTSGSRGDATTDVGDDAMATADVADSRGSSAEASTADAAEAGVQSAPPNCAPGGPGLTDCGSAKESCCTSLAVDGGTFYRTYDLSPLGGGDGWVAPDGGATGLADPATVSPFRLDKYDVTVARFRQFVNAWNGGAGWMPPGGSGKHTHLNGGAGLLNASMPGNGLQPVFEAGWASDSSSIAPTNANLVCDPDYATWTAEAGSNERRPINCVSWLEAYAFCIWDGGFLPSEAEWEYAAAGGNQQRTYPWGSTDPGTANQVAIYGCFYPSGPPGFMCTGVSDIAPVGTVTAGAGLFGHLDLAGEVYQWTLDWYADYGPRCTDCANLTAGFARTVRGGDFLEDDSTLLPPFRNFLFRMAPNSDRDFGVGIRCARSP